MSNDITGRQRDIIDDMYDDLYGQGYLQKDRDTFRNFFFAPGEQGYKNRKALYDDLHGQGYLEAPTYEDFTQRIGLHEVKQETTAAQQQPTGQAGAAPAGQTTSAGEIVGQSTQPEQPAVEPSASKPSASQTREQVKPAAVQQSAPVYKYTYFDESAIDPNEGELRMSMKPANWAYSERVNKSRGSHTKDNSPILRMSLDGGKLDVDVEREALAELKGMSDDEIYKYTNDLYNLTWGELTNEQRRDAASRLAAAGYELHVRDLGLGHAGDVDRNTDEVQTNLQDPKYRKLYDQGQWADPVDALSRQYDRLFAEQATGGTMGQQQATKMANRVLRAADKDQMFTWALQEAERTGGDPYKIYENIYDRFHAAVKDKLGAYNTRGQAAGLLGDIDAMIAEKWRAAEEADRSRGFNFGQVFADAENGGTRIADRLMDDPDMWALQYAKRTIEGVNNLIAEADHNAASGNFGAWLESSFAGGVARGFGQSVFDVRTWDMGFGDVRDATALMTALDKSDKGQPLTKAEQAMLDAKAVELAANAYFKSQVGYGYEAGKVTGESLPFMLEMMINPASKTGGLAVNKLVRYALKRFPQRGAAAVERQAVRAAERQAVRSAERSVARSLKGKILESAGLIIETAGKKTAGGKAVRAAVKTAGNVAGSAVMAGTTGLPGVIADTENRMIGQLDYDTDESGKAHVTGHGFGVPMITAFKQALVARGIENVTEMSEFDVLSNWLGGLTRKALDKLHMSDVYKFFDDIRMSDVAKVVQDFEKNTHWQGTFGEYLEEVEGGILNAWLVGDQTLDQDPETGVFNMDNNVKTFLGVSLLGGAFSAVQTVGYRTPKARMRKDIEDADKQASELWGGTWQQFKNSVDGADDEEMEALLANIVVNGNYSVDQRRAAAQYIKSVVAYRGAMKGEEIRAVDGESNPEDEQSYEQGYQVQGREREQVQDDLQRAEQRLDELDFDLSSFEGWTSDAFERRIASGEHDYTDEEIDAIREYFRAKAASDGMHQRVEDDIDTQVQQASDLVDKQTNQGTGMVHRATLNDGQEVYVTGGQLVMTGDGTMIDTEASDQSLFVYNPATGQAEQYNPSDFQSVDDPVNPEQLKSEAARDIRQAAEQQAEADMNGYVQQGESYDMVDEQGNALHGTVLELRPDNTAVVQVDGEQIPLAVPTQQLQTWVDNAKQARMSVEPAALPTRSAGARDNTANTGRVDNATNETIEAPAVEPMVMDEQTGEPAWLQSTPERGYQYLTGESGLSGEDITSLIDDRIAQTDAAIAKASKGGTIDQRLQARQAKDYWEGVKALHEAAKTAAQQLPTVQADTNGRGATASQGTGTTAQQSPTGQSTTTGQAAPAGTVRVEANQAETMPVGYTAVNIDGTRAEDRGQLGIRPEDEAYFLKTMSPRMMGLLNKVAKSLGWKIRLYNGVNSKERGLYNDGVVWVNRRAMTSKLAQWILGHEMTHGMGDRTGRGETFKDYKAIATAYHRSQVGDEQYEREVAALIKAYQDHLRSLGMDTSVVTREYVEEEIACDVTGDLLMNNPEMIGKLFSGVESPGKLKRIIDMIVDALDWIKKKLPFRSEEKQAFDDLIQRLNNLYRDAKAQTDIAKATAREEGSQIESGEGEREGGSFSITGNAEGSGFTASETVLEIWRVPQEDGTYKEEEHWVKKPLLDSEGNVVFRMGDKEFSGKNPITVDDLKSNPDTVLNYMLSDALKAGTIDEMKADQVRQQYADMLNLYLEKGMATEDGNGFENLEKKWLWVGETVFRTVASNSDEQYSYSMDITKVCKKNEAVIRAISALQVKNGYGVTPAQILEIYEATDAEGFQVPCPVCYVFSRYINNGKYATAIVNGMKKYGKYLPGQAEAKPVEWWVKEMKDAQARAKKMETPIKNANDDVKVILQQIDALCREITSGKLSAEEAESKRRHVRALDQRYRAALDVISQEALPRWIKAFVIEGSDQGGWSLREDAAMPEDMDDFTLHALDIRKTASAMEKYPALTRYRRAGGSAGGKEITFASNNELGTIVMGLGISKDKLDDYPNYYQLAAEAATDEERQALLQKARERFDKARLYAQRQTLRGGQRMWSWSDNIESLSSDVASNLMQLELLGGALQTYSKQLEGVKMVAAMNGYVNASLMGYGDGIREVGPDEIENGRLKDDIWDVNNKGRRRIIANAGSPVYHNEADGKDFVLVFDDVVGIDPFGHDGKRGLFSLNEEYDRAGNILVGMNDIHVRAAMADPRVFFIIPWHASGMSNHILQQMFNILGVNMDQFVSTDYTKMQEETNYLLKKDDGSPKKKVPKEVEDFWDSHTYEDEFACGTGHIENGDRDGGLSDSQKHYRALRDAIFDGAVKEGTEEYDQILADEFLSQVYRQVTTRVDDGKMTEKDKEFIYPYEYWDETSTVENADVNGRRYVEYCRRMGFKPKFTGRYDDKTGYSPEGNFADDPGYWKLLIDRRMYDRRGNYQDLTPVDSSGLDSSMYDPDQTSEEFNVTEVATNEGAEKIADIVYQRDADRTGSMPAPNLDMTMDEAVSRYKEVTALQASLIKAEREALTAADVAKQKVEKANTLKAQDSDGRKAKSVARAQESARKAMEVAKQKAREVDEIAGKLGTVRDDIAQYGTTPTDEARFSLNTGDAAELGDAGIRFSIRTKPAPKKTLPVYKLMRLGDDGKLYPLYIDGAVPIELGQWYDADSPNMEMLVNLPAGVHLINPETGEATSLEDYNKQRGITKKSKYPSAEAVNEATANGMRWVYIEPTKGGQRRFGGEARRYWNLGINGSGTVSTYSMRPGWHAGSLPTMRQIGKGPGRNLRDDRFVWVEGEISADVDYNEEAQGNPDNDIPTHIPVDGFYLKATNANAKASQADRVGWYISGAFKANRIMSDSEARDVIDAWNADPKHKDLQVEYDFPRESGKVFNAETMQLEDDDNNPDGPQGGKRFSIQGLDGYTEQDVLDGVRGDIEAKLEEAGVDDVTIKGMALHGSRMRGDARDNSDLDVVMEYDGDWSEDSLFDLLNEDPVYFDGIKVDINPITRGKSGTLEQYMEHSRRYDEQQGGKRFSIDDAAYAEAVEAGDQKKVTKMVKDAVKSAMPNTKAVDRWGKPRLLYHGTPQENQFYEFNGTIYMSSNRSVANEYTHYRRTFGANPRQTGRVMPVFVNLENPLEIDANRHLWRNIDVEWSDTPVTTRDIELYAKDNGYDGVIIRRVRDNMYDSDMTAADVYIAFSPEQVKIAGPTYEQKKRSHFPWDDYMELDGEVGATYDDDGNLIPLSERFDTGKRDIRYSLDAAVAEAEQMTETNPTDGQKESGNYRKGHVKVDGFDISIEQPKGSVRSGVDADGKEWSQEMHNTYGYIRGTEGVDGDHIDVFLSDHLDDWNGNVYVVDQVNKDRSFDEHKVMYGYNSEQEARDAYLSNYEEGWTGFGNITGVSREEFKKWVDSSHRKNKPFAEYKNVKPLQSTGTGDRARFSISERTDDNGNEVYTETREDGTKDREVVTMPDGSRDVTWFDEAGRKKEVLSYYPNGEVRQVNNYDSEGDLTRLIQYDENRRAIRHWEPRIGTDWERDENGVARGRSNGVEMVRYSLSEEQEREMDDIDKIQAARAAADGDERYTGAWKASTYHKGVVADGPNAGEPYTIRISTHPARWDNLKDVENGDLEGRVLSIVITDDMDRMNDWRKRGLDEITDREGYDVEQYIYDAADTNINEILQAIDLFKRTGQTIGRDAGGALVGINPDSGAVMFSLSEEQREAQIHSDNFKRWFGDWEHDPEHASKVVDENGEPKVVYHQTNAKRWINRETGEDWEKLDWRKKMEWENKSQEEWEDAWEEQDFYTFDDRYARQSIEMPAIFFSPENDPHHEYGNRTIAVYLNMRNPAINPDIPNRGVTDTAGRDAMEALKAQGYDGFIRTDEDGNILEYGVFDSNQVKSATDNNGDFSRENPDIRFSVGEESQKIFDTAKRKFGETKDIREAGYVLPDGVMLDFSGRHELDPGTDSSFLAGHRATDHRAINQISFVYDENGDEVDTGVSSDMPDFIKRGAIRIDNNAGSINLSAAPTMAQRRVLRELIRRNGGDVQVDFGDGWNSDHYVEYEEASAQRVLGDIDRYFDEGIKPESNVRFSLSGDGTVEAYNKAVNMTGRTFNVGGREVKPGVTRYNFQEAFQDAILSVKKLQQVVERHFGIKLPTRENAWMYENRLSSINMHERKSFIDKVYEPMMKIADRIMKRGVKEKELNAYLICKHGLERNQVFAMRDANEEANEITRNGGVPDMQQLLDKYRQRDYSGLTGVTGIQGDIADIEAEAQRIVDEFEQRHGQLCNELWDAIRKATQWSLRKSYQSGMMSAGTFDHVRNMFQYYIPLRGWSETTAEDVYSYMIGEHGAFNGVLKKAEGRTSVADDPLATIGNMAESALIQGNRNLLKQHLLRMAQNHPTDVCQVRDVWLVEGPGGVWEPHWPNIPDDATPDEIDQILQDHEADMQQLEASGQAKRVRNNLDIPYRIDPRHVPEHAVVAKVAGVDHVIYINGNPRAAQAINGQTGAGRGTKSGFSRLIDFIFGDVKRFYSSVLTSLNINFSGANFVRDLPHAYAMTFMKQGPLKAAEYIAKSFQVIPWVFKNQLGKTGTSQMDRYFQEFLSSGSVTGYAHINDVDAWKANNKRRFARLSALGKAKVAVPRALGEVINAIGWFSETLELIPRFTAFLVERQAGKDIATATKAAKDITTNFNKKGSEVTPGVWGAVANTLRYMKMFFNPIVQGMYQFVDVASMGKENKWVGPRMVLATMHLPILGAIVPYLNQFLLEALGGDDDDDYWLLNEYTRRNNVCIFTGNGYLKIPIAPVFRELYGMGEVVATRHAGKADNEKTTIDLIDQLRTMGSVEGQSSYNEWSLARFLLPEHFAPLIDVMNNENFTGGPIYYDNNYKEYAPEYTKAKKSTWSPLVAASKWLNEMMGGDEDIAADNSGKWMNPAVWQHLITNVGGGFAQLAGDVVAGVTDITEGKEIDPSNIPVMKRFYSGSSDERANWARFGIYKDYEKDYTLAKEKYQALDKRGLSLTERADEMVKFAESHPKAAAIYAVWEGGIKGADIPQQLSKLGKDDPKYWDLVKDAVAKAEKAMNSGYVRAWEQKRKDRPDSMSDKELNDRFDKSDNDSIRHIMADEISKRAGSQDWYGRDPQDNWKDNTVAAWEAYQDQRTSDDIQEDAELFNLLSGDERKKEKKKDKETLKAIRKQLGQGGDDAGIMERYRAARKRLIEKWQGQLPWQAKVNG